MLPARKREPWRNTMIIRQIKGNVFASGLPHIAFGINVEGENHRGFAGAVADQFWPSLHWPITREIGTVVSHASRDHIFHGLVCHYNRPNGFAETPKFITVCLNRIAVPDSTEIACVLVGDGPVGRLLGANVSAILHGIEASRKRVAVYSL